MLLDNDGALPLDPASLSTVAVIGPAADDPRLLEGDYHYPAHLEIIYGDRDARRGTDLLPAAGGAFAPGPYLPDIVTPLAGLRAALAEGVEVRHAAGCAITDGQRIATPGPTQIPTPRSPRPCRWPAAPTWPWSAWAVARGSHPRPPSARPAMPPTWTSPAASWSCSQRGGRHRHPDDRGDLLGTGPHPGGGRGDGRRHAARLGPGHRGRHGHRPGPARETALRRAACRSACPGPWGRCRCTTLHRAGGGRSQFWGDYTDSAVHPAAPVRLRTVHHGVRRTPTAHHRRLHHRDDDGGGDGHQHRDRARHRGGAALRPRRDRLGGAPRAPAGGLHPSAARTRRGPYRHLRPAPVQARLLRRGLPVRLRTGRRSTWSSAAGPAPPH